MNDAKYFRAQAELSLEIARQLSDPVVANRARLAAAGFLAKAEQLDRTKYNTGHNAVAIDRGSQPPDQPAQPHKTQRGPQQEDISHEAKQKKSGCSEPRKLARLNDGAKGGRTKPAIFRRGGAEVEHSNPSSIALIRDHAA
jgi:hypothetical protein